MNHSFHRFFSLALLPLVAACGGGASSSSDTDGGAPPTEDAAVDDAAVPVADGGALTACPTSGTGAVTAPGTRCFAVTPAETGASPSGKNATVPSYALRPEADAAAPRGALLLYFNGSGGSPAHSIPDPNTNFLTAATSLGYDVLALSYVSDTEVAVLCGSNDGCYFPTRETILRGVVQPGAAAGVQDVTLDQGVLDRTVLALRYLAARDPDGGWSAYLASSDASAPVEQHLAWSKIAVAGHSQGGGHAAAIAKLFPVQRVVQLSSTCDAPGGAPATWTNGTMGTWATDPKQFYGLAAPSTVVNGKVSGDLICPYHTADWKNLGMTAARSHDDADTSCVTGDTHGAVIRCTANLPKWLDVLR